MKDLALHILDLLQNSISAKADNIIIKLRDSVKDNELSFSISDNGKGMDKDLLEHVTDAYTTTRTTRKVGLGLPLLKQNVDLTGGDFKIDSKVGIGTNLYAKFIRNHIDCIPLGDIAGVIVMTMAMNEKINFEFIFSSDNINYSLATSEIKQMLDGISLGEPQVQMFLKQLINENISGNL